MSSPTQKSETIEWWNDILNDLEPDTTTITVTMSRTMVERTIAALTTD